jgi:hypothetical protein
MRCAYFLFTASTFVAHFSDASTNTDDSGSSKGATSFVLLPIPLSNQAVGSGLVAVGLSFLAPCDYGLNISVDYAIGKQGKVVYFYIDKAF